MRGRRGVIVDEMTSLSVFVRPPSLLLDVVGRYSSLRLEEEGFGAGSPCVLSLLFLVVGFWSTFPVLGQHCLARRNQRKLRDDFKNYK